MNKALTVKNYLESESVQKRIGEILKERADQFLVTIVSMTNNDDKLAACEPKSLVSAALTAVGMNLALNPALGYVYIIPYKDRKTNIQYAQLQLGYKAFIQLAMRSRQFKTLNVSDVREGEYKGINRLTGELDLLWIEKDRDSLPIVGYVSYMRLTNGFEKSMYMDVPALKAHGQKFSQTMKKGYGLWVDDFDSMARKTVLKLLLSKYAPMDTDVASQRLGRAIQADQAIIEDESNMRYIDNEKQTPQDISEEKERARLLTYIAECETLEDLKVCQKSCLDAETVGAYQEKERELEAKNG